MFDLIGNVREWTRDLWRDELTGRSEAWVDEQQYHAVRGLLLVAPAEESLPEEPAAYRSRLCAACLKENQEAAAKLGWDIGLRCARPAP